MSGYFVPTGRGEAEYDEKRSRFLGYVKRVSSEEEARDFIAEIKRKHHDARHNCWCYILHGGPERYSDDGEPQGTAGIPMLEVFRKRGVSDVVCVVTRYFGGVLLGAGGLLRAYTQAAAEALEASGISEMKTICAFEVRCSYSMAERLKTAAASFGGILSDTEYGSEVCLRFSVPEADAVQFPEKIYDFSAGSVTAVPCGQRFDAVPV